MSEKKKKTLQQRLKFKKGVFITVCAVIYCAVTAGVVGIVLSLISQNGPRQTSGVSSFMLVRESYMTIASGIVIFALFTVIFINVAKSVYKKKIRF